MAGKRIDLFKRSSKAKKKKGKRVYAKGSKKTSMHPKPTPPNKPWSRLAQ